MAINATALGPALVQRYTHDVNDPRQGRETRSRNSGPHVIYIYIYTYCILVNRHTSATAADHSPGDTRMAQALQFFMARKRHATRCLSSVRYFSFGKRHPTQSPLCTRLLYGNERASGGSRRHACQKASSQEWQCQRVSQDKTPLRRTRGQRAQHYKAITPM